MVRDRINTLVAQTEFLLDRQNELLKLADNALGSVLGLMEQKTKFAEEKANLQDLADIRAVYEFVSEYKQKSDDSLKEDIDFLKEQLKAIKQIQLIKEDEKVQELLNMIIDKDEKLLSMDEFKNQIQLDLATSKRDLELMCQDLSASLQEGNFKELRLMLEALGDSSDCGCGCQEDHDHGKDGCGCEQDSCGCGDDCGCFSDKNGCSGCDSKSDCCSSKSKCCGESDIFASLLDEKKK